jgi:hypothetical protein
MAFWNYHNAARPRNHPAGLLASAAEFALPETAIFAPFCVYSQAIRSKAEFAHPHLLFLINKHSGVAIFI